MMPMRLKNRTTRIASTNPRKNKDFPRRPIAKDETTILADSHYSWD
jgi:hypothetical protein